MCEHDEHRREIKTHSKRFLTYISKAADDEMLERFDRWKREAPDLKVPVEVEERILNMIHNLYEGGENREKKDSLERKDKKICSFSN